MEKLKKYPGHIAFLIANIFFGLNMVVSKSLMEGVSSPAGLNAMRFMAGVAAFWIISLFTKPEKVAKKDMLVILIAAVFGLMLNQTLFIEGLSRTSSVDTSVISTTLPMITMFISAMLLKEPISWMKMLGVLIGGGGAVFLIMSSNHSDGQESSLNGDLLAFGSAISFSFYLVIIKPITHKYSAVTIMKWLFLYAGMIVIPLRYKDVMAVDFAGMQTNDALSLGFTLIFATIIPYLIMPFGQKRIRPTTQSMYNYVPPIVTFMLAVAAGTNSLTLTKIIAALLVFVGVFIVTRSKSRADVEAAKAAEAELKK